MHLIRFVLSLCGFALLGAAAGMNADHPIDHYRLEMQGSLVNHYVNAGETYEKLDDRAFSVAGFEPRALELAHDGSVFLGGHQKYKMTFRGRKPDGPKEIWYYSLIRPNTRLGRDMRLEPDEAVSVLWWHKGGNSRMLHYDTIRYEPGLDWQRLETPLRDVLAHRV